MFGINNSNWHGNGIEWIGDAIEAIGYHCGFDEATVNLTVRNYRVAIPSNLESIEYIEHNGQRLPLGVDQSDYGFVRSRTGSKPNLLTYNECLDLGKEIDALNALREMTPTDNVLERISDTLSKIEIIIGTSRLAANPSGWNYNFYNIESQAQYIKTSFESGIIEVKCRRFRLDAEGFPLVVNTYKYKEAVSWFLQYRLLLSGEKHPELNWQVADEKWDGQFGFRQQAANEGKMLSRDEMERFKQRWLSVKRDAYTALR